MFQIVEMCYNQGVTLMKSAYISKALLLGIALSALPYLVLAEEVPDGRSIQLRQERESAKQEIQQKREDLRSETKDKRNAFQNEAKDRLEGLKKNFGEVRAKRIEEFFNNMVRKFENAIDRLDSLAERIENHLAKPANQGKDVTELILKLDAAKIKINDAEKSLNDAKIKFDAMSSSTDPKQTFKDVKILVQGVAKNIKEAHAALVDVVNSIRDSFGKATTTPS